MAYRILADGSVEGSTVEETIALYRALASEKGLAPREDKPAKRRGRRASVRPLAGAHDDPSWAAFVEVLNPHQRDVLRKIREDQRVLRSEIVELVKETGKSFARTMEAIKDAVANAGLKQADVFSREYEGFGAEKVTHYVAGKKLLANEL